jgi:hypothetical protein
MSCLTPSASTPRSPGPVASSCSPGPPRGPSARPWTSPAAAASCPGAPRRRSRSCTPCRGNTASSRPIWPARRSGRTPGPASTGWPTANRPAGWTPSRRRLPCPPRIRRRAPGGSWPGCRTSSTSAIPPAWTSCPRWPPPSGAGATAIPGPWSWPPSSKLRVSTACSCSRGSTRMPCSPSMFPAADSVSPSRERSTWLPRPPPKWDWG